VCVCVCVSVCVCVCVTALAFNNWAVVLKPVRNIRTTSCATSMWPRQTQSKWCFLPGFVLASLGVPCKYGCEFRDK